MYALLQAVTYAWTFRLQSHFGLEEMLLPLIGMDKINLIEKLAHFNSSIEGPLKCGDREELTNKKIKGALVIFTCE